MNRITLKMTSSSLMASAAMAALLASSPALAQQTAASTTAQKADDFGTIETVMVTAQRRSEREVDVPITITAINSDQLKQAGVNSLSSIATLTPAVRFDSAGAWAEPTIRGVGSALTTSGAGSNVGIYVDGFYQPNPLGANLQFLNVNSVQVLKGPQGTLFGHNTTGGAIIVTTAKPSFETSGMVDVSYGNYNTQRYEGYFTTGLTDKIAVDIGGILSRGDGYAHDIVTGSDKDGAYQNSTIRVGVRADITNDFSLLFHYQYTAVDDPSPYMYSSYVLNGMPQSPGAAYALLGVPAVVATKPHTVANLGDTSFHARTNTYQLTANINFNFATLTSYTQYSAIDAMTRNDVISIDQVNFGAGYVPFSQINIPNLGGRTITQEFLLNSNSDGRFKWTAGAFYMDWTDPFAADLSVLGFPYTDTGSSGSDTISAAVYGNATYEFLDNWYLSAGLRYSHDEVQNAHYINFGAIGNTRFLPTLKSDKVSPRVVLRYTPNDKSSIYASFSRGFKAPIYNVGGGQTLPIKAEAINAYEVGYKYAGRKLSFDVDSYYYDYTNLQVATYTLVNGVPASIVKNAASSRIYGFEGQMQYSITPSFNVNAGAAYTSAEYSKFLDSPVFTQCLDYVACGAGYGFLVASPQSQYHAPMLRAPKYTATLGARYSTDLYGGALTFSGNLYYTSKFYFDSSHVYSQGGYALLNLRAEWTDPTGMYTIAMYGKNVTDSNYKTQVQATQAGIGNTWGAPATFGAEVKVHF